MDKTNRWTVLAFTILGGLGGLACIFQWLGIDPSDLQTIVPNWLWLSCGFLLFGVSISLSFLSWRSSGKTIAEAIAPEKEEIKRLKDSLYNSARSNLEYRAERDKCEEKRQVLQKRLDDMFTPLQIEALQTSHDLLLFVESLGTPPEPKYTAKEIEQMSSAQAKALIQAEDGDYAEACEYHSTQGAWFLRTAPGHAAALTGKWMRLFPWYQTTASRYALEFQPRVEVLRHRFTVEGITDDALLLPIDGRDGRRNVLSIAAALWSMTYRLKEKETVR
jgi:hypothetical protein